MDWFDDERFWSLFYDWMFPAESFTQAKDQVFDIIRLSGVDKGDLLDLCCGPGRHSIPFAEYGFNVTGVDLQPALLEKARDYALKHNVSVEYVEENMLTFKRANSYDLAVSMFSSFGYFNNPRDDVQVLENVYFSLRAGGKLVLDVRGKEVHAMANVTSFSQKMPNGDFIFHRTEVNDDWTRAMSDWVYLQDSHAHKFKMEFNLYSGAELRQMLENTGFTNVRVYGDLKGCAYNQNAKRLVILALK